MSLAETSTHGLMSGLFPDDDFEEVVHKSDEEEDDILSAVAAMKQRDAELQPQLPKEATAVGVAEEAVGPSWSDLEASTPAVLISLW